MFVAMSTLWKMCETLYYSRCVSDTKTAGIQHCIRVYTSISIKP